MPDCETDMELSVLPVFHSKHWPSTGAFRTDSSMAVSQSGTYWLKYYRECTVHVDTFKIKFVPLPEVKGMQYGCPGQITFVVGRENDTSTYTYTLFDEHGQTVDVEQTSNQFVVNNLDQGIYTLKVGTTEGCDTILKFTLTDFPKPDILINPGNAFIQYGQSISLRVEGAKYYNWSPAKYLNSATEQNVLASPMTSTNFKVIGINEFGCTDTAYVMVEVKQDKRIVMPNAFSPNGDGKNDYFSIPFNSYQSIRKFDIYNRFGQLVYQDRGSNKGWDGTYKGKNCDQGVYQYFIMLDYSDGDQKEIKGDINLIR